MPKLKDDLFGDDDVYDKITPSNDRSQLSSSKKKKRRREGVGAIDEESKLVGNKKNYEDMTQKVLKIGKKRRHDNDDEEDEYNEISVNDIEDEEDLGRTAIATNKDNAKKAKTKVVSEEEPLNEAGKKLGKKERKRLKKENQMNNSEIAIKASTSSKKLQTKDEAQVDGSSKAEHSSNGDTNEATTAENNNDTNNKSGKKKRRKVRSRQKNIYKDTRPMEKRPKHLIPGNRSYQGRPLTDETRTRLNFPPTKAIKNQQWEGQHHHSTTTSMSTGDSTHPKEINHDSIGTAALGVDELLASENPSKSSIKATKRKRSSHDKKRKKYKNLSI